jgi:hypothetical protein
VEVIKHSWHTKVRDRRLDEDPLGPTNETLERERYRRNEELRKAGQTPLEDVPKPKIWRNITRPEPAVGYFFEATVRNSGVKKIRRLVWEYVFTEPGGGGEVGYRVFESAVKLGPGKSAKVVGIVVRDVLTVAEGKAAEEAARRSRGKYTETVSVRRIVYEDGTIWDRHSK